MSTSGNLAADKAALMALRFGVIFHYGLATFGNVEQAVNSTPISDFAPTDTNAAACVRSWLVTAQAAGAKIVWLTVWHNGDFALWPTATTVRHPTDDYVSHFCSIGRELGLKIGFYHGLPAWTGVNSLANVETRLTELLSNYGTIDALWLDTVSQPFPAGNWDAIKALVDGLQPHCVIESNVHDLDSTETDLITREEFPNVYNFYTQLGSSAYDCWDTIMPYSIWFWKTGGQYQAPRSFTDLYASLEYILKRGRLFSLNVPISTTGRVDSVYAQRLLQLGRATTDLALNVSSTASSTFQHGTNTSGASNFQYGPQKANNNSYDDITNLAISETGDLQPWFQYNLGSEKLVSGLVCWTNVGTNKSVGLTFAGFDASHNLVYRTPVWQTQNINSEDLNMDLIPYFAMEFPAGTRIQYFRLERNQDGTLVSFNNGEYIQIQGVQALQRTDPPSLKLGIDLGLKLNL